MPSENQNWNAAIIDNQATKPLEWPMQDQTALQQMLDHCRQAAPYTQTFDIDEREGYNGVQLFKQDERYTAFMGKLTHDAHAKTEHLTDLGRKLEKLILSNAPDPFRKQALMVLTIDFD